WRSVFLLGGAAPLVLTVLMLVFLPESVRYMVANALPTQRIRAALRRISHSVDTAVSFTMTERAAATTAKGGVGVVLARPYIVGLLVVVVFVGGTLMNMSQSSLPTLAGEFYPTKGRATGVAWMMGIGRFGGIAGSFIVAELTRRQLGFSEIFAVMAIPGVIAA